MTVDEFVRGYKASLKMKDGGDKFLSQRIVNKYVPYLKKVSICKAVIESCWHAKNPDGTKRFEVNSPNTYLLFVLSLVKAYTDIDVLNDGDDTSVQYDKLNGLGAILGLMQDIPKTEYAEFKMVLDMVQDDAEKNEYYIGSWLAARLDNLGKLWEESIAPALKKAGVTPEKVAQRLTNG